MFACLLFGLSRRNVDRHARREIRCRSLVKIPVQLMQGIALYSGQLLLLPVFIGQAIPPRAGGCALWEGAIDMFP